ncbi:MAG: hypothetical protein JWN21_1991 [Sphingomonas bacterium]|uniref:Coq4 family protein n=1 Tax=Sphingomonas bacterium TaxID=1895847 RepID=UPI002620443A|nr:Coq4 family protein [Sphingomonas bacterium]MDB5696448.1 hypothetical protein [Sphingomonas bacterium]
MKPPLRRSLPDAPFLVRAWIGVRAFGPLMRDVTDPHYGPLFQESLDGKVYSRAAFRLGGSEGGRRFLTQRPSLAVGDVDLAALRTLPPGSLGREYALFFTQPGVQPLVAAPRDLSDSQYLAKRMRETHDLHHLLTGYGIDTVSEHELQAFQYGNLGTPTSLLTLVATLHRRYPLPRAGYLRRLRNAYRRGRAAAPLTDIHWERFWETPLDQVRCRYLAAASERASR